MPPASPARSTITEPGFISFDRLLGDQDRRPAAGHERGRDHDVDLADRLGHQLLLARLLLGRQLLRVAARALEVAAEVELEEVRAERLDLLLDRGAHVEALDHRAQPARGRDRLQPGHAGAEHEHRRRPDRARRGHQHREEAAELLRADQRRAVAGDVGLDWTARPSTARG